MFHENKAPFMRKQKYNKRNSSTFETFFRRICNSSTIIAINVTKLLKYVCVQKDS